MLPVRVRRISNATKDSLSPEDRRALTIHRANAIGRMVPIANRRVLCIGLDACSLAQALAVRGSDAVGLDGDHVVIARPGETPRHHRRAERTDYQDLIHEGLFQTAVVVDALNREASPRTFLQQVLRVVERGALVLVQDLHGDPPHQLVQQRVQRATPELGPAFQARLAAAPEHDDLRAIFADLGPLVSQVLPLNVPPLQGASAWELEERMAYRYILCRAHN